MCGLHAHVRCTILAELDRIADHILKQLHQLQAVRHDGWQGLNIDLGATVAPAVITPSTVLNYIVDLGTVLDEQNIPETGRWLIIPPWVAGMVKKSDLRNASISGDGSSLLRNGRLGMIDRFDLYASNLLPTATEGSATATNIIAGHPHGLTFASQITKVETLRSELSFSTLLRGLQVFGAQVLDGIALSVLYGVRG